MDSGGAAEGQKVQQAPPPEATSLPRALPPPLAPAPDTTAAVAAAQPDAAALPAPAPAEAMEADQPSAAALPPPSVVPAPHSLAPLATHVAQQSGSVAMRAPESPSAVVRIERADSPGAPPADPAASLREHLGALQARLAKPHTKMGWSVAVWRPAAKHAEVVIKKSPYLDRMGWTRRGMRYLHVEEAVYLVERSDLFLVVEEAGPGGATLQRPMSLQESLEALITSGYPLMHYRVYARLARAGYIVYSRHPMELYAPAPKAAPVTAPPETEPRLAHRLPNLTPLRQADAQHDPQDSSPAATLALNVFKPAAQFSRKKAVRPDFRVCIAGVTFPSAAAMARAQAASGDVPVLHAIVDHGDIDFFGLGRQRTEDAFPPQ